MRTMTLTVGMLALAGCGLDIDDFGHHVPNIPLSKPTSCGCELPKASQPPTTGEATLHPHTTRENFLQAVVSFELGTTQASENPRNDWDLALVPSFSHRDGFDFRVNTVVGDASCIEDEGAIAIAQVGAQLTQCNDFVYVVQGHVYLVHTRDDDTDAYAAFEVTAHDDATGVTTLRWYRSAEAGHFAFGAN